MRGKNVLQYPTRSIQFGVASLPLPAIELRVCDRDVCRKRAKMYYFLITHANGASLL